MSKIGKSEKPTWALTPEAVRPISSIQGTGDQHKKPADRIEDVRNATFLDVVSLLRKMQREGEDLSKVKVFYWQRDANTYGRDGKMKKGDVQVTILSQEEHEAKKAQDPSLPEWKDGISPQELIEGEEE